MDPKLLKSILHAQIFILDRSVRCKAIIRKVTGDGAMNGERMFFLLMLFFIALDTESCFSKPISKTLPTKMESSIRWPSNVHRQLLQPSSFSLFSSQQTFSADDLDCDSRTGSWHTCMLMGCGVNVETDLFTLVTSTSCSYDQVSNQSN